MCAGAVGKDWGNMRFLPEKMRTKEICEIGMIDQLKTKVDTVHFGKLSF